MFKKTLLCIALLGVSTAFSFEWFNKRVANIQEASQKSVVIPTQAIVIRIHTANFNCLDIRDTLKSLGLNPAYHAIILDIDCTGGDISYFGLLHDYIKDISKIKPVIASVQGKAVSGGYMVASAANYILAPALSQVGNIGVLESVERHNGISLDGSKTGVKSEDVDINLFAAGKYKVLRHPYAGPLTKEQKQYLQNDIDRAYEKFITLVARNRNLDVNDHTVWADGKEFYAEDALELGLIDQVGSHFDLDEVVVKLVKERNLHLSFSSKVTYSFPLENNKK